HRLELDSRIHLDAAGIPSPAIEALERRQRSVYGCRLLPVGESSAILAQVVAGRVDQVGTVLFAQPGGEATQVAKVEPSGPGRDLFLGQGRHEGPDRVIGGTQEGLRLLG